MQGSVPPEQADDDGPGLVRIEQIQHQVLSDLVARGSRHEEPHHVEHGARVRHVVTAALEH